MDSKKCSKKCTKCGFDKLLLDFSKLKKSNDGYRTRCKTCEDEYSKEYYEKNKDKISIRGKLYCEKNKEKEIKRGKLYREKNKDEIKLKRKIYYKKNKQRISITKSKYVKKRLAIDPLYKLTFTIRRAICLSLTKHNYVKNSKTQKILGCSFIEFKTYLENKFEKWMNWDNHGKYNGQLNFGWDIDHIIPLCTAKCEEDIIRLNHYTNLQPLCSYTNRVIKHQSL